MKKVIVAAIALSMLSGCATYSTNIDPVPVSTSVYSHMPCNSLAQVRADNIAKLSTESTKQDGIASADTVIMTVGILFFPPICFGTAVTGDREDEIAYLKGVDNAVAAEYRARCLK